MAVLNPPGWTFLCSFHQCPPDGSPNCLPVCLPVPVCWLTVQKPFSMLNVKVGRAILVITLHGRRSEKCPPQLAGVGKSTVVDGGKKTNLTKGGKQTPIFSSSSLIFRPLSLQQRHLRYFVFVFVIFLLCHFGAKCPHNTNFPWRPRIQRRFLANNHISATAAEDDCWLFQISPLWSITDNNFNAGSNSSLSQPAFSSFVFAPKHLSWTSGWMCKEC